MAIVVQDCRDFYLGIYMSSIRTEKKEIFTEF